MDLITDLFIEFASLKLFYKFLILGSIVLVSKIAFDYIYYFRFWSSRGVKGPFPCPIFGNVWQWMTNPIGDHDRMNMAIYGRWYGTYNGTEPVLIVSDPEIIKFVFVTEFKKFNERMDFDPQDPHVKNGIIFSNGDQWQRERSTVGKVLNHRSLMKLCGRIRSDDLIEWLEKHANQTVDLFNLVTLHFLNILTRTLYDVDIDCFNNPDHEVIAAAVDIIGFTNSASFWAGRNYPNFARMVKAYLTKSPEIVHRFVQSCVAKRTSLPPEKVPDRDFLQTVLTSTLSPLEKMALATEIVGAGFLPPTSSCAFLLYELARNPIAMEKAKEEIDQLLIQTQKEQDEEEHQEMEETDERTDEESVKGEKGKKDVEEFLTYERINHGLPYLDKCYKESSRMHPEAARNWRRSTEEVIIPKIGVTLPRHTSVHVATGALHYDPEIFPSPQAFFPERWNPERMTPFQSISHQTFGDGPRKCLGEFFSKMTIKKFIITVLRRYNVFLFPGLDTKGKKGMFVPHSFKVQIKLVPRTDRVI